MHFFFIGLFVCSSWKSSTEKVISQMEKHTADDIMEKMESFFDSPLHINEANHYFLENGIIDINNKLQREKYFSGIIKANKDEVYSFSYGTENGEYYGARRNKDNNIEIIGNNKSTNGSSYYYSLTKDMTTGSLVEQTGKFDPRTRDWYIAAKEKQKPVFSSVYRHFVVNDLAISAAYPIYNKKGVLQGVLGTHLIISKINSYLKDITNDKGASDFIIEIKSGELVANSLEKPNFETIEGNSTKRLTIREIGIKPVMEAYEDYKRDSKNNFIINSADDNFHITVTSFNKGGLDWLIITSIPESQFTGSISRSIKLSILMSVIALLLAILIYMKRTELLLKPAYNLINAAEKFISGDFSFRAKVYRNDEIGKLSSAYNKMADQLYGLINNLEEKVKERTIELEKTNKEIVYLSYNDQLTGLYNRRYFEEELARLDTPENYPLAVIMGDMNGLKLMNDSLGHAMGDKLLKKTAEVLKDTLSSENMVARLGGDEFAIILPGTDDQKVEEVIGNIKEETVKAIISTLNEKNKTEEAHSRRVSDVSVKLARILGMPEKDVQELKTAALLHDIGKIAIEDSILEKPDKLNEEEWLQVKQHPEIGYRILNTVNSMSEISKYVLAHHEKWDGKGYPKGIKETEIPLQARIIAVADAYEAMTRRRNYKKSLSREEIRERLKESAGTQFDPLEVNLFIEKML